MRDCVGGVRKIILFRQIGNGASVSELLSRKALYQEKRVDHRVGFVRHDIWTCVLLDIASPFVHN